MRLMLLLFLVAFQSVAQEPIRVNVGLVSLSFGVRDARGVPVTNLGAADFDVFEDGVPQKISFFARSADLPLQLGLIADFSGSQEHFVKQHHKDLQEFLEEVLNPRDRAFLVCFGNHIHCEISKREAGTFRNWGPRKAAIWGPHSMTRFTTVFKNSRAPVTNAAR
jgi:hypothetical protein